MANILANAERQSVRVLRVISGVDPQMGGPAVSSVNSVFAAKLAGIDTSVMFPVDRTFLTSADELKERLTAAGVPTESFWMWRLFGARSRRWGISFPLMRKLFVETRRFDAVHAHGGWTVSTLAALLAARVAGRPSVLTPHESLTEFDIAKSGPVGRAVKRLLRRAYRSSFDLFVFSSEHERRDTFGEDGVPAVVVYHPVVPPDALPAHPSGRRIGIIGRLDPKKNVDVVIRALELLPAGVELVIAGTGPLEPDLRHLAGDRGVADRVTWLGFVVGNDKERFFSSIDVLAMPSANECFGMSAAEAMVRGVPTVVSPAVGLAELIGPAEAGLVAEPDPESVARALGSVLADGKLRARLAGRAVEAGRRELSLEAHGAGLRAAYERLTHAPPSSRVAASAAR